jgi:type IV pilus assembly protein PilA
MPAPIAHRPHTLRLLSRRHLRIGDVPSHFLARVGHLKEQTMRQAGFTLIELMIVVAIIGILAAIAIPAYQDYTIRAQVVEAFSLASELKGPIQEYRKERGRFPVDNAAAGVPDADKLIGNYVTRVDVHDGSINVTFGNFVNKAIEGQIVTLQPIVVKGSPASPMSWRCGYRGVPNGMESVGANLTNMDRRFLPTSCRS